MIHTLTIPDWHPTLLNRLLNCHWATRGRLKKADYQMVAVYAYQQGIPPAVGRRRVSIHLTRSGRGRPPDEDGVFKVCLDALVAVHLLIDDSPKWVELSGVTFDRGERSTRIILEDVP